MLNNNAYLYPNLSMSYGNRTGGERVLAELTQTVLAGQKVKYWGVNDQGQQVIKVMEYR